MANQIQTTEATRSEARSAMPACDEPGGPIGSGVTKRYIALLNTKTLKCAIHAPDCKVVLKARRPFEAVPVDAVSADDARVIWNAGGSELGYPKARICDCAVHV